MRNQEETQADAEALRQLNELQQNEFQQNEFQQNVVELNEFQQDELQQLINRRYSATPIEEINIEQTRIIENMGDASLEMSEDEDIENIPVQQLMDGFRRQ